MIDLRADFRLKLMRILNRLLTRHPFKDSIGLQFNIAKLLLPKLNEAVIVPTIYNYDVIVNPIKHIGFIDKDLYELGTYEPGILKLISEYCSNKSIIIDVGANIGAITLYAANIADEGKVISFEPSPEIFEDLQDNISLNRSDNIEIYRYALGSQESTLNYYPNIDERGSGSLIKKIDGYGRDSSIKVKVHKLDFFTKNLSQVDLIKIDVEGFEKEVLVGAKVTIDRFKPVIILEYDPGSSLSDYLFSFANKYSYKLFVLNRGKHYESETVLLTDISDLPKSKLTTIILKQ